MKKIFGEFYQDSDHKEYFYLPMLKSIYHIPKEDLARFNAFRQRLVIAIALGAIVYSFFPENVILSCFSAVLFYGLSTIAYFKSVLPKYFVRKQISIEEIESKVSVREVSFIGNDLLNRVIVILFGIVVTISGTYSVFARK